VKGAVGQLVGRHAFGHVAPLPIGRLPVSGGFRAISILLFGFERVATLRRHFSTSAKRAKEVGVRRLGVLPRRPPSCPSAVERKGRARLRDQLVNDVFATTGDCNAQ
jgi:hypothetical protein